MHHQNPSIIMNSNGGCGCCSAHRQYGVFRFLFDCVMIAATGGFWLIWVLIRESRSRRCC